MTKHLKIPITLGWLCYGITLISACQQVETETESDELRMSVVASIGDLSDTPKGRYAGSEPNEVEFATGDSIGVFIDDDPALKWTYDASVWKADTIVYWPDKTNEHTFCAFYPYEESLSKTSVPMPSLRNQSGQFEDVSQIDFLVATTTEAYGTDGVVGFDGEETAFKHVSSLLKLTIKGDEDLQEATLTDLSISGKNIVASSTYSFEDNAVTLVSGDDSDLLDVSLNDETNGDDIVYYFIVNEKTDDSVVTLTIKYTAGGKSYVATLDGFANNHFESGVQQSYTLRVMDRSLIISGSSISDWGEGEVMDDVVVNGTEETV